MTTPVLSKVTDGAGGGAVIGVVLAWVLTEVMGVEVPAPVAMALGSIITGVLAYFMPERNAEIGARG